MADGIGLLLFESVRGIKGKLNSCFEEVTTLAFKLFENESNVDDLTTVMSMMFERLAGHLRSKEAGKEPLRVWNLLHVSHAFNLLLKD
jgi:hypothetical protein